MNRKKAYALFKLCHIIVLALIVVVGIILLVNCINTSNLFEELADSQKNDPSYKLVHNIWLVELIAAIMMIMFPIVSAVLLFINKKISISHELFITAGMIWPLANIVEVFLMISFVNELGSGFYLNSIYYVALVFFIISVLLGVIATIHKLSPENRSKFGIAAFSVSALTYVILFFVPGGISGLPLVVNLLAILFSVVGLLVCLKFMGSLDLYFTDNFYESYIKNSTKSETAESINNDDDIEAKLEQLNRLLEKGLLNEKDYEEAKKRILDRI